MVQENDIFRKNYIIILLVVLVGCASRPSMEVREINHRYKAINRKMSRAEVHHILGQPDRILDDGRHLWRVEERDYYSELLVRFGPDGSIVELEKRIGQ
jgi:type IV pilus biogenesis protein CpaD/CtpE